MSAPVHSEKLIAEAGQEGAAVAPGAQVTVFGSHACREAGKQSDLDPLVVEPGVQDAAGESVRLRRALHGLPSVIELVVVSQAYVAAWRDVRGSFVHAALAEGRGVVG